MPLGEALLVTVLGMGVVFFGLMLCILAINFFNRLARHIHWGEHGAPEVPPAPEPVQAVTPMESVEPEILAVIAAAIEIERRLYQGHPNQRLTLVRTDA